MMTDISFSTKAPSEFHFGARDLPSMHKSKGIHPRANMISECNLTKPAHGADHSGSRPRPSGFASRFLNNWSVWISSFFLRSIPCPWRHSPPTGPPPLLHQQISVYESQQMPPRRLKATAAPKSAGRGYRCAQPASSSSLAAPRVICTSHPGFASPAPSNSSVSPAGGDTLQLHHQTLLFY